jgi:hypothetical protein
LASALTIATVAGCTKPITNDPLPDPVPTCNVRDTGEIANAPYDPFTGRRPDLVPLGWYWMVVTLDVRALPPVTAAPPRFDQCVPVAIHVYATQEGAPSVTVFHDGIAHPVPYDAVLTTPWVGTWFVFAYDPKSPRYTGRPPRYDITLQATYLNERDFTDVPPTALSCGITITGGLTIASNTVPLGRGQRAFVNCEFGDTTYQQ